MVTWNAGELFYAQHQFGRNFTIPAHPLADGTLAPPDRFRDLALTFAALTKESSEVGHGARL